jgi:hypothetical protein
MKHGMLKAAVFALIIIGTAIWVYDLNALPATWCRGVDDCDAVEQACLEGEFVYAWKVGTFCHTWFICRTQFEVHCLDEDEWEFYYRGASCDTTTQIGDKCNPIE